MKSSNQLKCLKDYSHLRLQTLARLVQSGDAHAVRDALDLLAGSLWFETLRCDLQQITAYGVGKRVQPHTYRPRVEGRWPQHNNLWAKYARGLHLPGADTVIDGNRVVPESGEILTGTVWKVLDTSRPIGDGGDELLRGLSPGVQQSVFKPGPLAYGRYVRRSAPNLPLKLLESRHDLDAIAATVVLLREAYESENRQRAFQIGRSLHATLLMAASCLPLCYIAAELIEFFIWQIFPLAANDEVEFDLDGAEFCAQIRCFNRALLSLEDLGRIKTVNFGAEWRKVLSFEFGFDLFYGLGPRWKLAKDPEMVSPGSKILVGENRIGRNWALPSLLSGRVQQLIPDEIEAQMALVCQQVLSSTHADEADRPNQSVVTSTQAS